MTTPAACEAGGSQAAAVAPGVNPDAVPTAETLSAAWDLTVLDREGKQVPFKDIVNASPRVLVMFIRHWFCPVSNLSSHDISRPTLNGGDMRR